MEAAELLQRLFDEKKLNILQIFFNNPEDEFYIREVAKKAKVSVSTTFRIIKQLKELELIKEHKLKKYKVYLFNKNKNSDFLEDLLTTKKSALSFFVEKASEIKEVESIILHGKEEKNKANVLLIGTNIPVAKIKEFVIQIKESYNFTIIDLNLESDQFLKMSDMGLFPGRRTSLFQR